jgi:hypothetical protein
MWAAWIRTRPRSWAQQNFFFVKSRPNKTCILCVRRGLQWTDSSPLSCASRSCCSLAAGRPARTVARVHQPDRASSGTEPLAASATAVTGDERRAPWIPYALSLLHSHIFLLHFDSKRLPFRLPFSLCSPCYASILPRSDLVLRRQCAGIKGRGRRRRALLRPLRLPRPLPGPRPVLPGKSPLRFFYSNN